MEQKLNYISIYENSFIVKLNITKVKNPGELHSYPGLMKIEF